MRYILFILGFALGILGFAYTIKGISIGNIPTFCAGLAVALSGVFCIIITSRSKK